MSKDWYVRLADGELGPLSPRELKQLVSPLTPPYVAHQFLADSGRERRINLPMPLIT
ncbi:MAG: hypothetical protein H6821_05510 [Planctomycetaceae bacterium]|nr:hypothetical protein [Planctomycetaceae bacterium]MCB9940168.1 hypothetical protein [Planctomycetaceae bacterium]